MIGNGRAEVHEFTMWEVGQKYRMENNSEAQGEETAGVFVCAHHGS